MESTYANQPSATHEHVPAYGEDSAYEYAEPLESTNPTVVQPTEFLLREIIETIILTLFIFWMVNTLTGRFRIEGQSMEPTLHEGQYVLINKILYFVEEPERGDIIVLEFPNDPNRDFIKRIIGVPGDQIDINNGEVRVNNLLLNEPYIKAPPNYSGSWTVPEGNYYVLGDNRNNSHDSHSWDFLPKDDIVGKAWVIYWNPRAYWDDGVWGLVPHFTHPIP